MNTIGKYRGVPVTHHIAFLILRLVFGGFMITHGMQKVMAYEELSSKFMDFMGLGAEISLILTIVAELACAVLLVLGLFTRIALVPLIIAMVVAAFVAHGDDPFARKEMALLYLCGYVALLLTGPGKFALDKLLFKK